MAGWLAAPSGSELHHGQVCGDGCFVPEGQRPSRPTVNLCKKKNPSRLAWISCHGSIFNSFYSIAEHKHTIQIGKQLLGRTVMITQHDLVVIRHSPP